jgi:hypothetical protein
MTDFQSETLSTVIDTDSGPSASGGGQPNLTEPVEQKPDAPLSLRDELQKTFDDDAKASAPKADDKGQDDKPVEKDAAKEPAAKGEAPKDAEAEKPAAAEKDEAPAKAEAKPEDGKANSGYQEPPKSFLADSKEVYRNVPKAVRRDIETMVRSHEEERTRYQEVSQRYDAIREFDELARSNGRDLRESLTKVSQIENMMAANPIAGVNALLMEVGPRKPDGQPVSLFELAQFVVQKGPQGYQQMVAQQAPQPQQPQEDPRVNQLQQQLQEMQQQQLAVSVIEPFKRDYPRYGELQEDIAFFLQSGKVPNSLSPYERLEAAYDMAVRINPASNVDNAADSSPRSPVEERRAGEDFSGSKSIKSSPGSVTEAVNDSGKASETVSDSIRAELRKIARK